MSQEKRCAIVGTAGSWKSTPWDDPTLEIWSLNDAYSLGMPRADAWFDLHPFPKMWFRPKNKTTFKPGDIPDGVYVRPEGHLEWMKENARTIPVWLQDDPPSDWPQNAKRFPLEDVKAWLKARPDQDAYVSSSPELMLALAVVRGYTEVHIYGIHLATQAEYLKQRPAMEWAIGKAEAQGVQIVLPPECPLLKHTHIYAYEHEPARPDAVAQQRFSQAQKKFGDLSSQLMRWPRWKSKAAPLAQLARIKAEMHDAQQQARHALVQAGG